MTTVGEGLNSLKVTLAGLVEVEEFVALANFSDVSKAAYVFTGINSKWDPKDHPRDPHTGEFMETPGGFIFGKTTSATFPLGPGGASKKVDLQPGDVAFKTPAGNIVVSHADGSYSLHHGSKVDKIPAGNTSTIASKVMAGDYEKVGENPGTHVDASSVAEAKKKIEDPAKFGSQAKVASIAPAIADAIPAKPAAEASPGPFTSEQPGSAFAEDQWHFWTVGQGGHKGEVLHYYYPASMDKPSALNKAKNKYAGDNGYLPPTGNPFKSEKVKAEPNVSVQQATDADLKVGNIVYKSSAPDATAWEVAAVGPGHSGGISASLKKPGSAGGTTNAAYVSANLYVKKPAEAPAAPSTTKDPATPAAAPHAGAQSAWDVPKPTLKPGKDKFTAKQYAALQEATKGLPMGVDAKGHAIKSGAWVEFEGKPLQLWVSPHSKDNGADSNFAVTAYRWVSTKQQASNLEKENFVGLGDFSKMSVIPDPTGKPYTPIGQEAPAADTSGDVKPKHGSLMAQAVTGAVPNTATAHKKHVESAKGQILTNSDGSKYLTDAAGIWLKSGDWVEIEGKPVQVHASPNAGNIAVSKWVSTKKQASNNTYDFPASVLGSATKIEDPTGKDYTPLADAPSLPAGSTAIHPKTKATYAKQDDGTWVHEKSGAIINAPKFIETLESVGTAPESPAPALMDVLKQHVDAQKTSEPDFASMNGYEKMIASVQDGGDITLPNGNGTLHKAGPNEWYFGSDDTLLSDADAADLIEQIDQKVNGPAPAPAAAVPDESPLPEWEQELLASVQPYPMFAVDENFLSGLSVGDMVKVQEHAPDSKPVYYRKSKKDQWAIIGSVDGGEWPTVPPSAAVTLMTYDMGHEKSYMVLPGVTDEAHEILNDPTNYPIEKSVTVDFVTYNWQMDGWYSSTGAPQIGASADTLDNLHEEAQALAAKIDAMDAGDELHITKHLTGKTMVLRVTPDGYMENLTTPSQNHSIGMKPKSYYSDYVLNSKHADKFSFQILAKGESTEDVPPKQQQFVHPASGVTFPLEAGDKVYKHKTADGGYIIVKGSGDNPINFFTQNGKQQKPKAFQKNLDKAYDEVDDWPGKVDLKAEPVIPGSAVTPDMIHNAGPGDTIYVYENGVQSSHITKGEDGLWHDPSLPGATAFETAIVSMHYPSVAQKPGWATQFYPNGTAPEPTPDTTPWGSDDAAGTPQVDPEPISTAPKPKKAASKKAAKPSLPTTATLPDGKQIDLKPGEAFGLVKDEWGEEFYVHVTQGPKNGWQNTNVVYKPSGQTGYFGKTQKWTPNSMKAAIKKNGGELLAENVAQTDKIDFSTYDATAFNQNPEYAYILTNEISGYIQQQYNQFPIKTNWSGSIQGYQTFDQFEGKYWTALDNQQKLSLLADYEKIAGDAVASLEPVAKFDVLDKSDKAAIGKTRSGFTLIHRVAILAQELNNPDSEWSDDKFEGEIAFVASKVAKPGVSLGQDLKTEFPIQAIYDLTVSANAQRKFKNSLTTLGFDPFNATTEEYDGYAKDKGFMHLAALTPDQQKAWVLSDLGDPTMGSAVKEQALKAAELVKTKIAVADLAVQLEKKQAKDGAPKPTNLAKAIFNKATLKDSYSWSSEDGHDHFEVANHGEDSWTLTVKNSSGAEVSSLETTDAVILNLVNGALDNGAKVTSSPKSAYGQQSTHDRLKKLALKHGVSSWNGLGTTEFAQIVGAEGGGPASSESNPYAMQSWIIAHAAGDEISKFNIEKAAAGGVHPNADTHPGSPTSPAGKAAHKALAELLSTTEGGQKWLTSGSINAKDRTELSDLLGLHSEDLVGTSYYDDWNQWSGHKNYDDLKPYMLGVATVGGKATKPGTVPDESWTLVEGVEGNTDLSTLFPSDIGIGALTDDELTTMLANDNAVQQAGLAPYVGSLPTHIKRLALWGAGATDSQDNYRKGVLGAVAAKAKAGEYMTDDTPAWVSPTGAKYPLSPGASVYLVQPTGYYATDPYYVITGPPKADGSASDTGWKHGDSGVTKMASYQVESVMNDENSTLVFTMPGAVKFDQAKKDIPDLSESYWNESVLIEEGKSSTYTHHEVGPILTAALKNNQTLQENYPHLYAQHKSLPENVRQAVLAALTGYYQSTKLLELMDYKASKGHYASMGTKGLFDSSQPWLPALSKGQVSESDVSNNWTPEAKHAFVAHFGLANAGEIAGHLSALLNPEVATVSKTLPEFKNLQLTKTGKSLGGMHTKHVWVDQDGNEWMSKAFNSDPNAKARVDAETGAMKIGRLYNFRPPAAATMPVPGYSYAYVQHLAPAKGDLTSKGPKDLTTKQLSQAMEEHLLDWITSNHDTHPQNLMIDPEGNVFGIDKGQAFKHFPNDKLAVGYLPPENGAKVWYDQFYKALQNGQIDKETADEVTKYVLRRALKISKDRDEDFRAELETALANRTFWPDQYPTREKFIDALVERKHNLLDDFASFYKGLYDKSPHSWDIDVDNLVPPKIGDHTHIAVSTDLANDVDKAAIHGKALFFNSPDLMDSHIMFSKVVGPDKEPMLTGTARVREKFETNLMNWLKAQTIQGYTPAQTQSYNDYDSTPTNTIDPSHLPGNTEWFSAMVAGSKTVSSHNASGNTDYNAATLDKMDNAAKQIAIAQQELADWKADNPQTPFKGTVALAFPGLPAIDIELHTMEQQAAWEGMLETYAGYAEKVNDHKGSDQKISPHFAQTVYSPSQDAINIVKAKQNTGKDANPFMASHVADILKKAVNGDDITVTTPTGTTTYTKQYGGWKPDKGGSAIESTDMESLLTSTKKLTPGTTTFTYSGMVPGLPTNVQSWTAAQEKGASITLLKPDGTYANYVNDDGLKWHDADSGDWVGASGFKVYVDKQGWKVADAQTSEDAIESSTTVQVGSKVLKVMYRKATSKAGTLNADGDLEMSNSEISKFDFGHMYEIDFGNTVIEYRPWDSSAGVAKAQKGLLKFRKKDWNENDSESIDDVLDVLRQVGLNLDPATEDSMELFYWRHMTGTVRDRKEGKSGGKWASIVKTVDDARKANPNMTVAEELQVQKDAWAKAIGQDKVDKADWHPQFSRNRLQALDGADDNFTSGRPYWLRPDITAEELKAIYGNKYVASSLYQPGDALKIAKSGVSLSSEERYRVLASGFKTGWSSEADATQHGSSGVVYTRQNRDLSWNSGYSEHIYYHPKVALRSHNYAFGGDQFGDDNAKKSSAYDPATMLKHSGSSNEMLVKYSASVLDDIAFIHFHSAADRNQAIQFYKDRGITTIHGLPLEQVFVTNRSDGKKVMDKLWADMIAEEKSHA